MLRLQKLSTGRVCHICWLSMVSGYSHLTHENLRVLIVGENATNRFGGEAILPLHYFRLLHECKIDTYLLTHERVKNDLQLMSDLAHENIYYLKDTRLFRWLNRLSTMLPPRLAWLFIGNLMNLIHTSLQWFLIRRIVKQHQINVIHQPIPVSPKLPSGVFGFGVPVVIGPMNGGMHFPPAFESMAAGGELFIYQWLRWLADGLRWLVPGKRLANILLVANRRTKLMLTPAEQRKARILPENGVLSVLDTVPEKPSGTINCLFVGRLVDWKAVDIIIDAVTQCETKQIALTIVGSGAEEASLKKLVQQKQLNNVRFAGFVPFESVDDYYQAADIFLLPSLRECGGAVVLEAMAHGLPVIATRWGGPIDYVTAQTGMLIPPVSREALVEGFKTQIEVLAANPILRKSMGAAAIARVKKEYLWKDKVNKMIKIYHELV